MGVAVAYAAIGVAGYWTALGGFFVSDDFEFLTIVASASNMTVVFEPLVGRYVRPFVVLMYYVCFRMFGLTAWPYHVAALAPHLLNSYLVFLVARRVLPDRGWLPPFLAGLLFLLFSSHSEAVAWPAGIADPILTTFLLIAFLFYLRGTAADASAWWIAASWAAMCGAALAKELWVIFPLIVLAHAVLLGESTPTARRRAAVLVGCGLATVAIYLVMRRVVFGSIAGGYAGLGSSIQAGIWLMEFRAFVLRCFVPAGPWAVRLWLHVPLVIWVLAGAALISVARSPARRVMLFAGAAMLLALAPVLPLTISVASTESERFTYFATAFSSLLIVAAAWTILRHRVAASIACVLLIAWHATVLAQAGARWRAAGEMARQIVRSFAGQVLQHDPDRRHAIFLLNLPDNLGGAYVYRRGFYPAVRLFAPEVADSTRRTTGIATNAFASSGDRATVQRADDRFAIDFGGDAIIQPQIASSPWYEIESQQPSSYRVRFRDTIDTALVLFTSAGAIEYAGDLQSEGTPFGAIDAPEMNATCDGVSMRVAGWALDTGGVARVVVQSMERGGQWQTAGAARSRSGPRPDVAASFAWLPNSDRAGWDYDLACDAIVAHGGEMRVRAVASDDAGHESVIGTRVLRARR